MQQSALRSVHPLSNERSEMLKTKVTQAKHNPAGGNATPGGLIKKITYALLMCANSWTNASEIFTSTAVVLAEDFNQFS